VGVTAVAAMKEGADLVVADYAQGSLLLTTLNALEQVGHEPKTVLVNWRKPTPEFQEIASGGFDIVLCADILYENKDAKPLVKLLGEIVKPDGEVWITEPGRDAAQLLLKLLRKRGWHGPTEEITNTRPDPNYHTLDLIRFHRLSRPLA
jgi:predicted nicotinamide N-methyase